MGQFKSWVIAESVDVISRHLEIEPEPICLQIGEFLGYKLKELGKQGIIIGLSGGFDSAIAA